VLTHRPRWASNSFAGPDIQPLVEVMHACGVDLLLAGHAHSYERFAPQNAAGAADPNGIREIAVGTDGRGVHRPGTGHHLDGETSPIGTPHRRTGFLSIARSDAIDRRSPRGGTRRDAPEWLGLARPESAVTRFDQLLQVIGPSRGRRSLVDRISFAHRIGATSVQPVTYGRRLSTNDTVVHSVIPLLAP
jgi:hypothetical protein